jgi:hypothetical protein
LKQQLGADAWAYLWHPDYTYKTLKDMIEDKPVDEKLLKDIGKEIGLARGLRMYGLAGSVSGSRRP